MKNDKMMKNEKNEKMKNDKNDEMMKNDAPIGAWKCNFPPFQETMTERQTNMRGHREVTLL